MALWDGRFEEGAALSTQAFGASLPVDKALYKQDIAGVARAMRGCSPRRGSSPRKTPKPSATGLENIEHDIDAGNFTFDIADEDIHMAIEAELTRRIGEAGGRLHTGRSPERPGCDRYAPCGEGAHQEPYAGEP